MLLKLCELTVVIKMIRTYQELTQLKTFDERFDYLKLNGQVSKLTFGVDRYLNQIFYKSEEWLYVRAKVIARDLGCDLGVKGYDIYKHIIIHHMNPITVDDVLDRTDKLLNPDYLITTSLRTHNGIHYGKCSTNIITERHIGDTCPWKH